jgi:hypothetical protein
MAYSCGSSAKLGCAIIKVLVTVAIAAIASDAVRFTVFEIMVSSDEFIFSLPKTDSRPLFMG